MDRLEHEADFNRSAIVIRNNCKHTHTHPLCLVSQNRLLTSVKSPKDESVEKRSLIKLYSCCAACFWCCHLLKLVNRQASPQNCCHFWIRQCFLQSQQTALSFLITHTTQHRCWQTGQSTLNIYLFPTSKQCWSPTKKKSRHFLITASQMWGFAISLLSYNF